MSWQQVCCHAIGISASILSAVLLVGGFVLIIVFSSDFDAVDLWSIQYSVGIAAICLGTLLSIVVLIYTCCSLRQNWKVFGFIKIKAPKKQIAGMFSTMPSKDDVDRVVDAGNTQDRYIRPTHYSGANDKYTGSDDVVNRNSREDIGWDPDVILGD